MMADGLAKSPSVCAQSRKLAAAALCSSSVTADSRPRRTSACMKGRRAPRNDRMNATASVDVVIATLFESMMGASNQNSAMSVELFAVDKVPAAARP